MKRLGLDIGSTTIKCVVLDSNNEIVYKTYKRHRSKILEVTKELLVDIHNKFNEEMHFAISGSAGMGLAQKLGVSFVQEVYATKVAIDNYNIDCDCVIELGGEDAKILFLKNGFEMRMNGTCAGGTGAFIDQMASLMNVDSQTLNELSKQSTKIYTIASRCGVFAKSDVQPLLNQGAKKEDVATSILYAVVNQTIGGLSQGRQIKGKVLYLGGPLTFLSELRKAFDKSLKVEGILPDDSLYFVSIGAALNKTSETYNLLNLQEKINTSLNKYDYIKCDCLFKDENDYNEFKNRHEISGNKITEIKEDEIDFENTHFALGIDAGSTTVKVVLTNQDGNIFNPLYLSNNGNPVTLVKDYLLNLYEKYPNIKIVASCVTGYGEDIIKNSMNLDFGIVETMAHFKAAKHFKNDVDFIIDIGGQDIKCFKIRNNAIDNIYLNEACSSGCGSFLQTFAKNLNLDIKEFTKIGTYADSPVDLGSRCTVFMNSSVKQAQKDGATIENIIAGLCISVVKNALYKVIRCANSDELGQNIVVQGGTFLNDLVLRAFEKELNKDVVRPKISGLMGAYGCSLYALERYNDENFESKTIKYDELKSFIHTQTSQTCKGCNNHCHLTINDFGKGKKYIAGNRCDKFVGNKTSSVKYDMYEYKLEYLKKFMNDECTNPLPTIGIPLTLSMYELLPFYYTFFKSLGFNVVTSPISNRKLYLKGQYTIPSDTICYPAKLAHGHIEELVNSNVDYIFFPQSSYNLKEGISENNYNCPVVAYYPEVIKLNVKKVNINKYINDFVSITDNKEFEKRIKVIIDKYFKKYKISAKQIKKATIDAYNCFNEYKHDIITTTQKYLEIAKEKNIPVICLCGRPYHIDSEVNHGINNIITSMGAIVICEDGISQIETNTKVKVKNQWTYHARLYQASKYVANRDDISINLVQLVSFGCGVDAITTDEVRSILEEKGKIYTQLKIDEISNMGAVKIRLRSLFASIGKDN